MISTQERDQLFSITACGFLLPTGAVAETLPRARCASSIAISSAVLYMYAIGIPFAQYVTSISCFSLSNAVTSHLWFALYDYNYNLLQQTNDDTSATALTTNAVKTLNLQNRWLTTYSGLYYVGVCFVTASG